jgi:hypothetical protein
MKLSEIERDQLRRAVVGENIASSDRASDRARTRLKKLGYLHFDRAGWRWIATPAGRAALEGSEK